MRTLLKILVFVCGCVSIAHAQSLPACNLSGGITASCYLPRGSYVVSSTITITQNDILIQCQPGATLVQGSLEPIIRLIASDITIDGCTFDANNQVSSGLTDAINVGNGGSGITIRNSTVKNTLSNNAGENAGILVSGGATNVLIEKNRMLGPTGGVISYSPVENLQIIDNVVTGQISVQSPAAGGSTISLVIAGNVITPQAGGGCVVVQDASSGGASPNFAFTLSHNVCRIQGTTASTPVFGAFSLVSSSPNQGDSGVCSVADNVVQASGQYISFAVWEIGLTGCTFSGNLTNAGGDTANQSYGAWIIYSGNNTFTGNDTIGWGGNGGGMVFYPQNTIAPYGNNNVVSGGSLVASTSGAPGKYGLSITCNVEGSAAQNLRITGLLISGAFSRGVNSEDDHYPSCPVSFSMDATTVAGAVTGIETSNSIASVGKVDMFNVQSTWVQGPGTVALMNGILASKTGSLDNLTRGVHQNSLF
jgi:hypothetical protein